jgi:hypothetical protein
MALGPRLIACTAQSTRDDMHPLQPSGIRGARLVPKWRRADVGVTHKEHSCRPIN